jgi:hypothetical protein
VYVNKNIFRIFKIYILVCLSNKKLIITFNTNKAS